MKTHDCVTSNPASLQGAPPLPPGGPGGDDDYDDDDEDTYEEAEPYQPDTPTSNTEKAESESSYYESYGEEDDDEPVTDSAHYIQWSASQPCLSPAPESRLCGFLWRRKWLGQWSKQLFIIRRDVLLCYKSPQDARPQQLCSLIGCQLVTRCESSRKLQQRLKMKLLRGSSSLLLGYGSELQAARWREVIQEVSAAGRPETRAELLPCRSSSEEKPEEQDPAEGRRREQRGVLSVLMNCQWQSLLCRVEAGLLTMFAEEEEEQEEVKRSPQYTVPLRGCEVIAGPAPSLRITLSMLGEQLAALEVSSSGEKQLWLKRLQDGAQYHSALSGLQLQTQRFPTSSPDMMDPFHLSGTVREPIYCNTSNLEHMLHSCSQSRESETCSRPAVGERAVQKLELAVKLRAESETNLASAGRQNKRTSFRQSLAVCSERAQVHRHHAARRMTHTTKTLFIHHKHARSISCCQQSALCWSLLVSTGLYWSLLVSTGPCWCLLVPAGLSWSLLVSTGVYWSLLVSTGPCWSLLVPAGLFWSLLVSPGPCWSLLVSTGPCWSLLVPAGPCWSLLVPAGLSWSLLVPAGLYWCLLVPAGLYWSLLVPAGVYWSLLVSPGPCWSLLVRLDS
ncbi:uncharacterized protein si:dkey-220o5.5 isoform X2 [Clinocottus analis]|uniref:uncharacterized protein si:dkey-220o5.5 isoform X2 n=1 Tax=Clinocottus analis TaxID=304258 RepID=UPI0035C04918